MGYESLVFDQNKVHTLDITMAGWDDFIANAAAEEYVECSLTFNGERFNHVAIRAKGNTSLSSVTSMGSTRYSFKVEFDHYVKGMTYHGLDKLSLNNLIHDATMMKDYLAYTLMRRMEIPSPLCSYVQLSVNGEPWGLYLAVEGVEEAFMERNGMARGELYKPDSMNFGGGRGNAEDFTFDQFRVQDGTEQFQGPPVSAWPAPVMTSPAVDGGTAPGVSPVPTDTPANLEQMHTGDIASSQDAAGASSTGFPPGFNADFLGRGFPDISAGGFGGFNFGTGNSDVRLVYTDENPDSYRNIFDNAKTQIKAKDKVRLIEALRRLNAREDLENTVDRGEIIQYLAVHNFLCNDDSYTGMMVHNYYLYEENGRLSIIPWDYNLAFGGFAAFTDATATVNNPIDSPVSGGTVDSRPLIAWIFSDEVAMADYHDAYDRFIQENLESGWLAAEITRIREMVTPYLQKDSTAFYNMEEFGQAVDILQVFCQKRSESIRGQLDGAIPATSQGQREDSSFLVDASGISTGTMGSMNIGGNGPGEGGFPTPSGMMGGMPDFFNAGGFVPPSGFPQHSKGAGDSVGVSPGNQESGAQTFTSAPEQTQSTSRPGKNGTSGVLNESTWTSGGVPGQVNPAYPPASNGNRQWVQLAVWSLVLLAAILIIRRVESHNH